MLPWRYHAPKLLTIAADLILARLVAALYCCLVIGNYKNVHTARRRTCLMSITPVFYRIAIFHAEQAN
jgi:hypothetical protein